MTRSPRRYATRLHCRPLSWKPCATFTLLVIRNRGFVDEADTQAFLAAGFTQTNILEVILGAAQKLMSNYTNHFAQTPVDQVFQKFAWERTAMAAE